MAGLGLLDHVPLDQNAIERQPELLNWLRDWMGEDFSEILMPEDWFRKGHRNGTHVWCPPPAVALAALEELAMSKLKRPYGVTHVVLVPRLMFNTWRRRFVKEVDLHFELPVGSIWSSNQHEPLVVRISFPLCRFSPWRLGQTGAMVEAQGALRCLSREGHVEYQHNLRELWTFARRIAGMSQRIPPEMLRSAPL